MSTLPQSVSRLETELYDIETEYVNDIGSEKYYGLSLSSRLSQPDGEIVVQGYIVLDPETGKVAEHTDPKVYGFPDGMLEEETILLEGDDAFELISQLFEHSNFNSVTQPRRDVTIDLSAK